MAKCQECKEEFNSIRKTARFCSVKCRQKANYQVSVGQQKVSVEKSVVGQCHGCKETVDSRVCICASCIAKGVRHENLGMECPAYPIVELPDGAFLPNWKRLGLSSKEEGLARVLKQLDKDSKKITSHSSSQQAVFFLGDRVITLS